MGRSSKKDAIVNKVPVFYQHTPLNLRSLDWHPCLRDVGLILVSTTCIELGERTVLRLLQSATPAK